MNHVVHASFSHLYIDFNLKIEKVGMQNPLIALVFKHEHSELKFMNVQMLNFTFVYALILIL